MWQSSGTREQQYQNQNSIHEEIRSKLISGNAFYHSVQGSLSSGFLSKKLRD